MTEMFMNLRPGLRRLMVKTSSSSLLTVQAARTLKNLLYFLSI